MAIKVSIIDDHPLVTNGLITMLKPFKNIKVCATYETGAALIEGLKAEQPDVLLLDIMLPDISGKDLAVKIQASYPDIRIIALTSLDAPGTINSMMSRGCLGYLLKNTNQQNLVAAIEQVFDGYEFIEPSLKERFLKHVVELKRKETDTVAEISEREKEILELIVAEHTTQEIADKLFISFRTVENHRYSLMHKLDVKNTAGLVRMAMRLGIVE